MSELTIFFFIVGTDLNAVWDPIFERLTASSSGGQSMAINALKSWASNLGLVDIWRLIINQIHHNLSKTIPFSLAAINLSLG